MTFVLDEFERSWRERWPGIRPGDHGWLSRNMHPSNAFSSLPESKSLAETGVEYAQLLHRHHVLLAKLLAREAPSANTNLIVITRSWSDSAEPVPRDRWLEEMIPAAYLTSMTSDLPEDVNEEPVWSHLYVTHCRLMDAPLTSLFLLLADEEASSVAVMPSSLSWIYEPFRDGVDIWGLNSQDAAALDEQHPDWLPVEPPLLRQGDEGYDDLPGWDFESAYMPEASAKRLREVAQAEDLLLTNGHVHDPRRTLSVRLNRHEAQLWRIVFTGKSELVVEWNTRLVTLTSPLQASAQLRDLFALDYRLDAFLDEYGYRDPEEAIDDVVPGKFKDPGQSYPSAHNRSLDAPKTEQ